MHVESVCFVFSRPNQCVLCVCFRYTPRLPALPIITETHQVTRPLKHRAAAFPAPSLCQVNTKQLPNALRIP